MMIQYYIVIANIFDYCTGNVYILSSSLYSFYGILKKKSIFINFFKRIIKRPIIGYKKLLNIISDSNYYICNFVAYTQLDHNRFYKYRPRRNTCAIRCLGRMANKNKWHKTSWYVNSYNLIFNLFFLKNNIIEISLGYFQDEKFGFFKNDNFMFNFSRKIKSDAW